MVACRTDDRDRGCRFDYRPVDCEVTTRGKLFTHVPLFSKQYNLVLVKKR